MALHGVSDAVKTRDDRPATEKADGLANKTMNVLARLNDLRARLVTRADIKNAGIERGDLAEAPRPCRMLHDALSETSETLDHINGVLDDIGQRL